MDLMKFELLRLRDSQVAEFVRVLRNVAARNKDAFMDERLLLQRCADLFEGAKYVEVAK